MHRIVFSLALVFIFHGCGTSSHTTPPPDSSKLPLEFPYTQGWMGADAAYSVPLGSGKSLWLFGDTFVGDANATNRNNAKAMVRNSIGISQCDASCTINYYWKNQYTATPRSFFDTGSDALWYWPMDGFLENGVLYLAMSAMHTTDPNSAFGFDYSGTRLFIINNPTAAPDQWSVQIVNLTDGNTIVPGVSIVLDGDFAYFFTMIPTGPGTEFMTLARVPRTKLADITANWQYVANDGTWHAGLYAPDAKTVIDKGATEMTVRYHASLGKWIAVSPAPEAFSGHAAYRSADSYLGPWSDPKILYDYPEMKTSNPGYDKDTFCYAAKEHVEFATDAKIVLTYACNSLVLSKTVNNMSIYRPQVVELDARP